MIIKISRLLILLLFSFHQYGYSFRKSVSTQIFQNLNKYKEFKSSLNSDNSNSALFVDRIESVKVAICSGLAGTTVSLPLSLITGSISHFDSDWQVKHISLVISLLLFGITYRYSVRNDKNNNLKQGVVGAFALTRTLSMIEGSTSCSVFGHDCGIF